jgi:hypothetical protein
VSTYVALLDGGKREESIQVEQVAGGVYDVTIGGRTRRVDACRLDAATLSLLVDAASYTVTFDARAAHVNVRVRDAAFPVDLLDERRQRQRREASAPGGQGA